MRILVIHDELYPNTSANARIVYRIVDELAKHSDIEITIMGCARTEEQFAPTYHGCNVVHSPWEKACKYQRMLQSLGKHKWLRYLLMPRSILYRLMYPRWTPRDIEMMRWIFHHRRQFDVILACSMPFYPIDIASRISKYIPVVNYYMEPFWGILPSYYPDDKTTCRQWDGAASRIIAPNLIKKTYVQHADDNITAKIVVAEFPNIVARNIASTADLPRLLNSKSINLAFAGKFYPKVRDPQYLFDIMDVIHSSNICLTMAGGFNGSFPRAFVDKYFSNKIPYLQYVGMLPPEKADDILLQADILVHIGNTNPMFLPSKILDYISTGKPILNLYQHDECPTLEILDAYPLKLNIRVGSPITNELIQQIIEFCVENRGKQIPFEEIEPLYWQYTPRFVGEIFYKMLLEAKNEKSK